tara:strand:+ start:705 stop:911 length:207 start_codon:yes stop_codon:yes gene_type:complete
MTRFSLRFDADGPHEAKSLEFERADGSFLFWLEETVDGREFEVAIDMGTPFRVLRCCANGDFWIIRKA